MSIELQRVKDLVDCHSMNTIECEIDGGVLTVRAEYLDCFGSERVQCYEVVYGPIYDDHGVATSVMAWKLYEDEYFIDYNS